MTPRELEAYAQIAENSRNLTLDMFANLLASLHNGPLTRVDKKLWTPAMFRLGAQREEQNLAAQRKSSKQMALEAAERMRLARELREKQPEAERAGAQIIHMYEQRSKRAREAKEAGYPREVINRIMEGVG